MEILTRGTCRFLFDLFFIFFSMICFFSLDDLFYFPFYSVTKVINGLKCLCILAFLYLLVSLPFSYTSALRTYIGTLLSLNIIKSNNKVFIVTLFQSQNAFSLESLHLFLTQRTHLLHIIFKFTLQSWQVPRSSVGRALYRESGPSQDGDPDTGNLPFFFFSYFIFFFNFFYIFLFFNGLLIFYQAFKQSEMFLYTRLFTSLHQERFTASLASLPFSYTLKLRIDNRKLLKFNVIKSSNKVFVVMLSQS